MIQQFELTTTQKEVLSEWDKTKRSIIEIPTGTGKSIISVKIMKRPEYKNILTVCFTNQLVDQWKELLENQDIVSDVYTMQTAYKFKNLEYDLLVVDEAHHVFSPEFIAILDNNIFHHIIMLTATLKRDDNRHLLLKKYNLSIISNLDHSDGIREKLLSRYEIINQSVDLEDLEQAKLNKINDFININFEKFHNNFFLVKEMSFKNSRAAELMRCFQLRKKILNNAFNKRFKILDILLEEKYTKCIVYNEFINQAEEISQFLTQNNLLNKVYHSKSKNRKDIIQNFKDDKFKILIAVKSLDEGLNIPDIDLAIIAASTSQPRQTIQRVGRVLRYQPDKIAKIYNLYTKGTKEEQWLKRRISEL